MTASFLISRKACVKPHVKNASQCVCQQRFSSFNVAVKKTLVKRLISRSQTTAHTHTHTNLLFCSHSHYFLIGTCLLASFNHNKQHHSTEQNRTQIPYSTSKKSRKTPKDYDTTTSTTTTTTTDIIINIILILISILITKT